MGLYGIYGVYGLNDGSRVNMKMFMFFWDILWFLGGD